MCEFVYDRSDGSTCFIFRWVKKADRLGLLSPTVWKKEVMGAEPAVSSSSHAHFTSQASPVCWGRRGGRDSEGGRRKAKK